MSNLQRFRRITAVAAAAMMPSLALAIGSTPVNVVNPADIAKALGVQQPFHVSISCNAAGGFGIRCFGATGVPAGQRWAIEYVSASCLIDNTRQTLSQTFVSTTIDGNGLIQYLAIPDRVGAQGDSGSVINVVQLGQLVRLYADAGSGISIGAGMSGASTFAGYPNCVFTLSGQAVSVP